MVHRLIFLFISFTTLLAAQTPPTVNVEWDKVVGTSKSTPTLQVVVNPMLLRGSRMHDGSFQALAELGANYVRYVPWEPYPKQAVAELKEPKDGQTFWDFQYIDPTLDDFMKATAGHSVCINFSTIPAWMFRIDKPVLYPDDPNQVFWNYTQGAVMRDPTYQEAAGYFARLLSWYEKGGFTDEAGKWHASGHHYKFTYWEVLNEIDLEHKWDPEQYTKFYDSVVGAMRQIDPDLKFMAIALAHPSLNPRMFEYFLNPAHHKPGIPIDFITYHYYAEPTPRETLEDWQYTFFATAQGFVNTVRYVEEIRKRLNPSVKTDLNELGVILQEDFLENRNAGYVGKPEPEGYFALAAAMYAHLFAEFSRQGIDVIGESQLVGYPSQFPSVTMMDYHNSRPNPRFWVLKLLLDNFHPGDKLVQTDSSTPDISAQAYETSKGRSLLLINLRNIAQNVTVPAEFAGGSISCVAVSTGDNPPATARVDGRTLHLESFETAVVSPK
jgi:hypothetical protein